MRSIKFLLFFLGLSNVYCQSIQYEDIGKSKSEYIVENHLEDIEELIHKLAISRPFIEFLLEQGHDVDHYEALQIKKKDVSVGEDVDIYVKHFSEHQNFTMILVPVNIYPLAIYDTLLFSVLEVSDEWLHERFWQNNLKDDSVKNNLLSIENHSLLSHHLADLAMRAANDEINELKVNLHESYISTNSIHLHIADLASEEKKSLRKSWGLLKKAFTHNIDLNVEMNIYIFGQDDMEVIYYAEDRYKRFGINPTNIFTRHHFNEN